MVDRTKSEHVHRMDAAPVIDEYRRNGYVLKEQTKPTITAQRGFIKLIFVPIEDEESSDCG